MNYIIDYLIIGFLIGGCAFHFMETPKNAKGTVLEHRLAKFISFVLIVLSWPIWLVVWANNALK